MRISKKAICQYLLLYAILLLNQSVAASKFGMMLYYVIIIVSVLIALKYCASIFKSVRVIVPIVGLSISILLTRFTGGSAGIGYVIIIMTNLFAAMVAYKTDKEKAADRYVNIVCLFSVISVTMFIASLLAPEFTRTLLGLSFVQDITFSSGEGWINSRTWNYYGHWLYSFGRESDRNCGLYTEPGLYAIVLVSALILLLFKSNKLDKSSKKIKRDVFIIVITLITAASATGFIMAIVVFAIYFLQQKKRSVYDKGTSKLRNFGILVATIIAIASVDYAIRGNASFLYQYLLSKFNGLGFQTAMQMSGGSTGNARLMVLVQGVIAAIRYPFGAGTNRMSIIATEFQSTYYNAGCGLAYFLGVLGIFGWAIIVSIFVVPVSSRRISKQIRLLLIIIYIIYGMSQANFWASTLLLVAYIFEGDTKPVLMVSEKIRK